MIYESKCLTVCVLTLIYTIPQLSGVRLQAVYMTAKVTVLFADKWLLLRGVIIE